MQNSFQELVNSELVELNFRGNHSSTDTYNRGNVVWDPNSNSIYYSLQDDHQSLLSNTDSWLHVSPGSTEGDVLDLFNSSGAKGQLLRSTSSNTLSSLEAGTDDYGLRVQNSLDFNWEAFSAGNTELDAVYSFSSVSVNQNMYARYHDLANHSISEGTSPVVNATYKNGSEISFGSFFFSITGKTPASVHYNNNYTFILTTDNELWHWNTDNAIGAELLLTHVKLVFLFNGGYGRNTTEAAPAVNEDDFHIAVIRTAGTDNNSVAVSEGEIYYKGSNYNNFHPIAGAKPDFTKVGDEDGFINLKASATNDSFYAQKGTSNQLWVWGKGDHGQLARGSSSANGSLGDLTHPTHNTNFHEVDLDTFASAGDGTALKSVIMCGGKLTSSQTDPEMYVWGYNGSDLTDTDDQARVTSCWGSSANSSLNDYPQLTDTAGTINPDDIQQIAASHSSGNPAFAIVKTDGDTLCKGGNGNLELSNTSGPLSSWTRLINNSANTATNASLSGTAELFANGMLFNDIEGVQSIIFLGGSFDATTFQTTTIIVDNIGGVWGRGYNKENIISRYFLNNSDIGTWFRIAGITDFETANIFSTSVSSYFDTAGTTTDATRNGEESYSSLRILSRSGYLWSPVTRVYTANATSGDYLYTNERSKVGILKMVR